MNNTAPVSDIRLMTVEKSEDNFRSDAIAIVSRVVLFSVSVFESNMADFDCAS